MSNWFTTINLTGSFLSPSFIIVQYQYNHLASRYYLAPDVWRQLWTAMQGKDERLVFFFSHLYHLILSAHSNLVSYLSGPARRFVIYLESEWLESSWKGSEESGGINLASLPCHSSRCCDKSLSCSDWAWSQPVPWWDCVEGDPAIRGKQSKFRLDWSPGRSELVLWWKPDDCCFGCTDGYCPSETACFTHSLCWATPLRCTGLGYAPLCMKLVVPQQQDHVAHWNY